MKYTLTLGIALAVIWQLWSGHHEPFLFFLGFVSVALCVVIARRMRIADEEGTPFHMGPGLIWYWAWLIVEIVKANLRVARVIVEPKLRIKPRLISVPALQKTELGRVILANSITLTPGTVSVDLRDDRIWVHTLVFEGNEDELIGEMARRICGLET